MLEQSRGRFHKSLCALHWSFMPYAQLLRHLKTSQKLGVGCKLCGVGRKPIYKIDLSIQIIENKWSCSTVWNKSQILIWKKTETARTKLSDHLKGFKQLGGLENEWEEWLYLCGIYCRCKVYSIVRIWIRWLKSCFSELWKIWDSV